METYYRHRRMAFSHSRVSAPELLLADLHKNADCITDVQQIQPLNDHSYEVPRATDVTVLYEVDTSVGVCSCIDRMFRKCCKHQYAIQHFFSEALTNSPLVNTVDWHSAAVLALGDAANSAEFYSTDVEDTKHPNDRPTHTVVVTTASMEDSAAVAQLSQHSDDTITSDTSAAADQACALLLHKVSTFAANSASGKTGLEVFMTRLNNVCNESQLA